MCWTPQLESKGQSRTTGSFDLDLASLKPTSCMPVTAHSNHEPDKGKLQATSKPSPVHRLGEGEKGRQDRETAQAASRDRRESTLKLAQTLVGKASRRGSEQEAPQWSPGL